MEMDGNQYRALASNSEVSNVSSAIAVLTVTAANVVPNPTMTIVNLGTGDSGTSQRTVGETISINAGTRVGFNFVGWSFSANATFVPGNNSSTAITSFIMPDTDIMVTANWVAEPPTLETPTPTQPPTIPTQPPTTPTQPPGQPPTTPTQPPATPTVPPWWSPTPTPPSEQWEDWIPDRPRSRGLPPQPPTTVTTTPTQAPSPTPTTVPPSAATVNVPVQASSLTTVNQFRQTAPSLADALFELGLFVGTGVDASGAPTYELGRQLNRMEALTIVIRLMGLEERALAYTDTNPFSDTPEWGSRIAAFAYSEGITAGIGDGSFAPDRLVTYQEFTAFLLRVLGYFEVNGDFLFEQALDKSVETGLYSANQRDIQENASQYLRSDAVLNMVNALLTNTKDANTNLIDILVANNVISREAANQFVSNISDIIQF